MNPQQPKPYPPTAFWLFAGAYFIVRLLLIPQDAFLSGGFDHDSAYITTVADQVRAGHGLVNPAHWLVFLMPEKLPMPFHNANPGYPLLVAGVSSLLHSEAARAGLVISIVAHIALLLGVFFLVSAYTRDWRFPALAAVLVALYPLNFADSLDVLPDSLSTSLSIWSLVALTRKNWRWSPLLAGVFLGGAWLARSSASLVWPALLWWVFRSFPLRQALRVGATVLLAFLVVISPWLIYTYNVWGSPFRSDASYYLMQDYLARPFNGDIDRYWRSLHVPPTLGAILKADFPGVLRFYLDEIPTTVHILGGHLAGWNKFYLLPLAGLFLTGLSCVRRVWRTPEFQAGLLLACLPVLILNIRASTFEPRYLGPSLVVALLLAILPCYRFFDPASGQRERILGMAALLCAGSMYLQDVQIFRHLSEPSEELVATRRDYLSVAAEYPGPILVQYPYFFAYYSGGRSALSPPVATREELLSYMNKYSAHYLALPTAKLAYYYPLESLRPEIQPVKQIGSLTVLERVP